MTVVHHVDCASMCPLGKRVISGEGSFFERGEMPAHCLIVETAKDGIVLVDTGFGDAEKTQGKERLGGPFSFVVGLGRFASMRDHLRARGLREEDVRHIVVTHLDLDHAGGLVDFPHATVHIQEAEVQAALHPTWRERSRYRAVHFAHNPKFETYRYEGSDTWRGFSRVRALKGLRDDIFVLPLEGHTRGHSCVGIEANGRTILHAGDAYFHRGQVRGTSVPPAIPLYESLLAIDSAKVRSNHVRLTELAKATDVDVFCAHDPEEFRALQKKSS